MSFLLDPPALVATGAAIERFVTDPRARAAAGVAVVGTYVGFSTLLYLDVGAVRWFARMFGAESGRDWMINSRVTRFEHERPRPAVHALAVATFATYPAWYRLGRRLGRSTR